MSLFQISRFQWVPLHAIESISGSNGGYTIRLSPSVRSMPTSVCVEGDDAAIVRAQLFDFQPIPAATLAALAKEAACQSKAGPADGAREAQRAEDLVARKGARRGVQKAAVDALTEVSASTP